MITITNNSIILPQGETAVISFGFKDIKTGAPLILSNQEASHFIHIVIKETLSNTGEAVLARELEIKNSEDGWRIFKKSTVETVELTGESLTLGDITDDILNEQIKETDVLYKIILKDNKGAIKFTVYKYKTAEGVYHDYDYTNSSITLQFNREDTKNLQPKTYYMEIYHQMIVDGVSDYVKHTLLRPIDFIIKGALA